MCAKFVEKGRHSSVFVEAGSSRVFKTEYQFSKNNARFHMNCSVGSFRHSSVFVEAYKKGSQKLFKGFNKEAEAGIWP